MTYLFSSRPSGLFCAVCFFLAFFLSLPAAPAAPLPPGEPPSSNTKHDDICPRPELLQVDQVTDSTARLTWSDVGDKYEVEIAIGTTAFTGVPGYVVNADPPFDVSGLVPGRNYRFQVRTVCDDSTASVWSAPRSFATDLNNARPCPLNFDLRDTSCNSIQSFEVYVDEAPGSSLGTDVLLRGVRLMVEHAWRSDLSIWLVSPDNTRIQLIGGLNAGDQNIGDPAGSPCAQYLELTDDLNVALPLSAAAEQDNITGYYLPVQALAGMHSGQNPVGIWKLEFCDSKAVHRGRLRLFELVFARPDCAVVDGLSASGVTENSASLSWQTDALGDSLLIEYGPVGFIPGTAGTAGAGALALRLVQPAAAPVLLSGLQTLQTYEVCIRRQCAPGVWGPNSYKISFFTACPATLLESVDTLPLCSTANCPDPCPLPGTWQNVTDDDYEWKVLSGPGLAFPVAGPPAAPDGSGQYLYFRNACSPTGAFGKTAILRTLCLEVSAPSGQVCHFSMDLYMNTKIGQNSSLAFQVSTDGGQSWSTRKTWNSNLGKLWRQEYVDLSPYHGLNVLCQLVATGTFGAYADVAIDNLAFYGTQVSNTPGYTFYRDADGDTYGDPEVYVSACFPVAPPGYVAIDSDCDDTNPAVFPGAPEVLCNQIDENCNGLADDALVPTPGTPAPVDVCFGGGATLSATGLPNGQFYWYAGASGGAPIASGNTLTLSNLTNSETYFLADSLSGPGAGCASERVMATVTVHPKPVLTLAMAPSICDGSSLNLATLAVVDTANAGGVLSYHSATPPAPANQLPTPVVQPGFTKTYYVLSTTAFGCTGTRPVTVTVLPSPEVQILQGDSINTCRGRTLQLQATEAGIGLAPISYTWSTGLNFPNIPVQAGNTPDITTTYTVSATDARGCVGSDQIKVHTLNNVTQTAIDAVQNVSICGGTDGSITLRPLNGTAPYTFAWSGGSISGVVGTGVISGLGQGSYRVTVTDATQAGCSMVMPQIVLNAPGLDVVLDTIIHPDCPNTLSGSIVLVANGQNPTFEWNNQQTGATASFLGAGLYSVTITDGNCTQTLTNLEVTEPLPIDIKLNKLEHVQCLGDSNGLIDLAVFGATAPYSFNWSEGSTTEDLDMLPGGTYHCSLTDANGCLFQTPNYTINEPSLLSVAPDSLVDVRCFGEKNGYLRVKASGGAGGYSYLWNTGATSANLGLVTGGLYIVTVTDANGCTAEWVGVVSQPSSLQIEITQKQNPTCIGSKDGSIGLIMSGGQAPFQFQWSNNASGAVNTNLSAGIYRATITDAKGCTLASPSIVLSAPQLLSLSIDSLAHVGCRGGQTGYVAVSVGGAVGSLSSTWNGVPDDLVLSAAAAGAYVIEVSDARMCSLKDTIEIEQPDASISIAILELRNALCAGEPTGSVSIRASGGTPPYLFDWSNGAHTQNLPAVPAGQYSLTLVDANGCTAVLPAVSITEPLALTAQANVHDIPCFGVNTGDIQLAVGGGIAPYSYIWSTQATTQNVFNLPAGAYSVTVLDATGCANVLSDLMVIDQAVNFILEPVVVQPVSCNSAGDGQLAVRVLNGTPPYQFAWSPPIGLHTNVVAAVDTAKALSGGDFWVTVTDAMGCTVASALLQVEEAPNVLLKITEIRDLVCKGDSSGQVIIDVSGGLPPYQYLWNTGMYQDTANLLVGGNYRVTVTDLQGCTVVSPVAVVHEPASALQLAVQQVKPDPCGKHEGVIQLTLSGGVSPYDYLWSNMASTASLNALGAGMYQLTATDNLGCTLVSPVFTIEQLAPGLALADTVLMDIWCFGDSTGGIQPNIAGGTPPYQYFWSNGAVSPAVVNVPAGLYRLTVSDGAGCFDFWNFNLLQPATAVSAPWAADSLLNGWSITLAPQGGIPPYEIQWDAKSGNQTGPVASGLAAGFYRVTVTDGNDCTLELGIPVGTFTSTGAPDDAIRAVLAPNPAAGYSRLWVAVPDAAPLQVQVFSAFGQLLIEERYQDKQAQYHLPIDLSAWPPGLYWIVLRVPGSRSQTLRLVHTGKG